MTDRARYAYHDGLAMLSSWSDSHARTSAELTSWIERTARPSVALIDIGTGDGAMLSQSLKPVVGLYDFQAVHLVEPDDELRERAVRRLVSIGISPNLIRSCSTLRDVRSRAFTHALLSHVVYYLPPIEEAFAAVRTLMAPEADVCLVIRSEDCDTYQMRRIVRRHEGLPPRLSLQSVLDALSACDFGEPAVTRVAATLRAPGNVAVLPPDSDTITTDESFDYFIRWMTRLPVAGPIDVASRESLRTFVRQRADSGSVILTLEDVVITASAAPQVGQPAVAIA